MVSKVPLWCSYWTNILEWLSQSLFFFSLNHISFKLGGCFRHISRSFGCYSRRRANLKRVTARRYYRHYIIQYGVGYVTVLSVRILILLRGRSTRSWSRSEQLPTSSNWLRLTSSGVLWKGSLLSGHLRSFGVIYGHLPSDSISWNNRRITNFFNYFCWIW